MRHVVLRNWREPEFYLNYMSLLFICTEVHTLKGSSEKATLKGSSEKASFFCTFHGNSLYLLYFCKLPRLALPHNIFRVIYLQILEVHFASVCVIFWNMFSNITHNSVIRAWLCEPHFVTWGTLPEGSDRMDLSGIFQEDSVP